MLNREIFARLQQATAGQPEVLGELCRDYLIEARMTVAQLRNAVAEGNATMVRERAHYLKGSSMMLGAEEVTQSCATLEAMGRDSNLTEAKSEVERVSTALKSVETVLVEVVGPAALPAEGSAA